MKHAALVGLVVGAIVLAGEAQTSTPASYVIWILDAAGQGIGAASVFVPPPADGPHLWAPGPVGAVAFETYYSDRPPDRTTIVLPDDPEDPDLPGTGPWTISPGDRVTVELAWRVVLERDGVRHRIEAGAVELGTCAVVGEPISTGATIPVCGVN